MTKLLCLSLLTACLATALPQGGPEEPCTLTIIENILNGCTTHPSTETSTSYTDCSGCVLSTVHLRGPVCTSITTATDIATTTQTSCAATPTCTVTEAQSIGALSSATCTQYETMTTQTVGQDCGGNPGCAVVTRAGGPGPAVSCGTWVTSATGTAYSATCTS